MCLTASVFVYTDSLAEWISCGGAGFVRDELRKPAKMKEHKWRSGSIKFYTEDFPSRGVFVGGLGGCWLSKLRGNWAEEGGKIWLITPGNSVEKISRKLWGSESVVPAVLTEDQLFQMPPLSGSADLNLGSSRRRDHPHHKINNLILWKEFLLIKEGKQNTGQLYWSSLEDIFISILHFDFGFGSTGWSQS